MSYDPGIDIDLDKDIDVDVDVSFDTNVDIDFDKDVNIDVSVYSCVDVYGNFAQITFDAQAVGHDGLVEADLVVLTIEDQLAMVSGSITSATG